MKSAPTSSHVGGPWLRRPCAFPSGVRGTPLTRSFPLIGVRGTAFKVGARGDGRVAAELVRPSGQGLCRWRRTRGTCRGRLRLVIADRRTPACAARATRSTWGWARSEVWPRRAQAGMLWRQRRRLGGRVATTLPGSRQAPCSSSASSAWSPTCVSASAGGATNLNMKAAFLEVANDALSPLAVIIAAPGRVGVRLDAPMPSPHSPLLRSWRRRYNAPAQVLAILMEQAPEAWMWVSCAHDGHRRSA